MKPGWILTVANGLYVIGLWEGFLLVMNIGWFMGMCPSAQPNNIGMEDRDSWKRE